MTLTEKVKAKPKHRFDYRGSYLSPDGENIMGWFRCHCGYVTQGKYDSGYFKRRVNKHWKLIRSEVTTELDIEAVK